MTRTATGRYDYEWQVHHGIKGDRFHAFHTAGTNEGKPICGDHSAKPTGPVDPPDRDTRTLRRPDERYCRRCLLRIRADALGVPVNHLIRGGMMDRA